jgi:hypothetical protein
VLATAYAHPWIGAAIGACAALFCFCVAGGIQRQLANDRIPPKTNRIERHISQWLFVVMGLSLLATAVSLLVRASRS